MKRVTFVCIGIIVITVSVMFTEKKEENLSNNIVKVDATKHQLKYYE